MKNADLIEPGLPTDDAIDFLRLIWAVDHALQRRSKVMAAQLGVTGPQRLVIRMIGRFPSISAGQLAELLHLDPSSLTALSKRLECRGLIRRRRDERDRRRARLGLTPRGQQLNRDLPKTVEAAVERMLRTASRRDLEGARVVLSRLAFELDDELRSASRQRSRAAALR